MSFKEGLTRPSWAALASAALQVPLWFGLWAARFDENAILERDGEAVAFGGVDDFAYATARGLRLARWEDPRPPVVIVGSSCTREALSGQPELEAAVVAAGADAAPVWAMTLEQTIWEEVALAEQVPAGRRALVVLGVAAHSFSHSPKMRASVIEEPRIGIPSALLDAEAAAHGLSRPSKTGWYAVDQWSFTRPRLWTSLLNRVHGPIRQAPHQYEGKPKVTFDQQVKSRPEAVKWITSYGQHRDETFAFLRASVGALRARGSDVVFWNSPLSMPFFAGHDDALATQARYLAELEALAAELDVPIWRLDDEVKPATEVFADSCHVQDPATRLRYDAAMAAHIAEWSRATP